MKKPRTSGPRGSLAELVWFSIHLTCTPARRVFPLNYLQPGFQMAADRETNRERAREINDAPHLQESSSSSFVFIDRLLTQTCLISPGDCSSHCDGWVTLTLVCQSLDAGAVAGIQLLCTFIYSRGPCEVIHELDLTGFWSIYMLDLGTQFSEFYKKICTSALGCKKKTYKKLW